MKKFLCYLMGLIVALCLLLALAIFIVTHQAPSYAARNLSNKMQVPVTVGDISFSIDKISVYDFTVYNVPDSALEKACSIKEMSAHNNIFTYLDDVVTVELIDIKGVYLGLEFDTAKGATGNWTTIMNNVESSTTKVDEEDKQVIEIKKLVIRDIEVDVVYLSSGRKVTRLKPIDEIVLYNINSSEGLPSEQIMKSVFGQMLKSVFVKENLKNMMGDMFTQPQNAVDTLITPFKGIF